MSSTFSASKLIRRECKKKERERESACDLFMASFFIFMYFPGLSGCRGIFGSTSCQAARQKSGFSSIEPSGRARQGGGGLYILPRKCAADFRGDRLCLLEICHTANGQPGAGWRTNVEEQRAGIEGRGKGFLPAFDLSSSTADTDPRKKGKRTSF